MTTNEELLKHAIIAIKRFGKWHGRDISEQEIAKKLNISEKQLFAYLNNEEKMPDNLASSLLSSYGLKNIIVSDVQMQEIRISSENKDEQFE